jgi:hypothetical protein
VPNAWKQQIVTYACDPRIPSQTEQVRWWGWATTKQRNIALRALTELTLRKFIALLRVSLEGTAAEGQFEKRADMLIHIFELGKVIDARLLVHENVFHTLPSQTRQVLKPFKTSGGQQHTSFICLKCSNDLYLIEGTHSFALRGFVGENRFPIPTLWQSAPGAHFHDSRCRVPEHTCDIFQRHTGDWVWNFNYKLRQRRIEWRGL